LRYWGIGQLLLQLFGTAVPQLTLPLQERVTVPHLIACGLIGEPVPPVIASGGPQKKNS
jgi:hypothetical protein